MILLRVFGGRLYIPLREAGQPAANKNEKATKLRACSHNSDQGVEENSTQPDALQTEGVSQVAAILLQEPEAQVGRFAESRY